MDYEKILSYYVNSTKKALEIYQYLVTKLPQDVIIEEEPQHFCFRINLPKDNYKLSISVIPDSLDGTIEIMLVKEEKFIYMPNLGYKNVCQFKNKDDLLKEIMRLADINRSGGFNEEFNSLKQKNIKTDSEEMPELLDSEDSQDHVDLIDPEMPELEECN